MKAPRFVLATAALIALGPLPSQAAPADTLREMAARLGACLKSTADVEGSQITIVFALKRDGALLGKPKNLLLAPSRRRRRTNALRRGRREGAGEMPAARSNAGARRRRRRATAGDPHRTRQERDGDLRGAARLRSLFARPGLYSSNRPCRPAPSAKRRAPASPSAARIGAPWRPSSRSAVSSGRSHCR